MNLKLNNSSEYKTLKVKTAYSLGGYNYFSSQQMARGYSVHLTPCTIVKHDGFGTSTQTSLMGSHDESGYKVFIEGTKRKSAKRLAEISKVIDDHAEVLRDLFQSGNHQGVYDYVKALPVS
jgi:hypothetical protein|tara:strand:+ start:251 stop:613 length:363 start_codon:yes stop_codon:yes gene_type:complete